MDNEKKLMRELGEMLERMLEKFKDKDIKIKAMYLDKKTTDIRESIFDKMAKNEIDNRKIEEIIIAQETFLDKMKEILGDDTNE